MPPSVVLVVPTTTSPARVARVRKLPANVDQATMTLAGSSAALPVSAGYSDFVRAPMGPIERSTGHGAWKLEVSASLDVGESWNLGVFLAHALTAHGRLQEQRSDVPGASMYTVWATGVVDVIDLRILPVGHIETKARQALAAASAPNLFLLPPDNLGDIPAAVRVELEARGTRIIAPTTMAEALEALELPADWAKGAAPEVAGWRGSPYRGLEAYEAAHRPIFFGRGHARAEALERLRSRAERGTSLLVIHGKSGVGKSSLAMAGLLSDVVEKVPGRAPFGTAIIRFGDGGASLVALRNGFARALGLEDIGLHSVGSAADWIGAWPANGEPRTLLLILDQLEQALLADAADAIAFGEALAALVRTGRVWIIATLRSDRIDLLERAPALAALADGDGLYRLVRPSLPELSEIIRAPAKLAGIEFAEGEGERLIDLLAQEAMSEPDSLPLLQVTLVRLAEQRDAAGRVGMRDYERIGGFSGAVERLADETVRKIEDAGVDASVVDRALATLVRIDPETDRVDARVVDPDMQPAEVERVLGMLVEARLATASTLSEANDPAAKDQGAAANGPQDSGRRVRLAHETLIREWPRLCDLAARLRAELALRDRLEEEAVRWEQDGRPTGDLIRNTARLTAAEELVTEGLATPSPQARAYILVSRSELERQTQEARAAQAQEQRGRSRRRIAVAASLVAVLLLGMAGFALNQNQQTRAALELAETAQRAAKAAAEAANQAELAANLQANLAEEQNLRRAEAEQATEQANALTEAATEARRRAEEQLDQAQKNQTLFLLESAKSMAVENPSLALQILAERSLDLKWLQKWKLYDEVLATVESISLQDRELTRLLTSAEVRGVAFSPDGTKIVTGSSDSTARVWDVATGATLLTLEGHQDEVYAAAFSPDGTRIVTGSADSFTRVWDAATGITLLTLEGHQGPISAVAFSPDGTRIVTGSSDNTARVWDVATGVTLLTLEGHQEEVWNAAFSPDGTRIVTGSSDNTARVWDVATGTTLLTLEGHQGPISGIAFSPDGTRIVTGSWDRTARVWDAATGVTLLTFVGHQEEVWNAAFSPDGTRIVTAAADNRIRFWDAAKGTPLRTLVGHENSVSTAAFSPDGTRIVAGAADNTARVWDVATGKMLLTLEGHQEEVWNAAFSPDGTRIVTGSDDGTARVWDAATGTALLTLVGHQAEVNGAAFSPDGTRIITSSNDDTARVWDAATGKAYLALDDIQGVIVTLGYSIDAAAFSPDGTRVVTGSGDNTARVWDVETGTPLLTLVGHQEEVNAAAFSPDGTRIVTGSNDGTARIWDVATGTPLLTLEGDQGIVSAIAFSPDGTRIVTGYWSNTMQFWDAATGIPLLTLVGHQEEVNDVAFSPDGTSVIIGSFDSTPVWDVSLPKRELLYDQIKLVGFEQFSAEQRRRFFLSPPELFAPGLIENISAAREALMGTDWQIEALGSQNLDAVLASWRDAAAFGVPEAHEALSTALLSGQPGLDQDLEAALFHAAIATRLYEALRDEEHAAPIRIRRANLARTLPAEKVAAIWPRVRDWRPEGKN